MILDSSETAILEKQQNLSYLSLKEISTSLSFEKTFLCR